MNKLSRPMYQLYKWGVFLPGLAASTIAGWFAILGLLPLVDADRVSRMVGQRWARFNAKLAGMKVIVKGRENIQPGRPYVICSNHQSHFDILVVYGFLGLDVRWVMKQELRKVPFLGHGAEVLGHIYIDRSNREKAIESINKARETITGDRAVMFFPEGTRSDTGELQPFKKGAFRMAVDLDIPILPLTIRGTNKILPARTLNLSPGKAELIIHKPVKPPGKTPMDLDRLMERVRNIIQKGLETGEPVADL